MLALIGFFEGCLFIILLLLLTLYGPEMYRDFRDLSKSWRAELLYWWDKRNRRKWAFVLPYTRALTRRADRLRAAWPHLRAILFMGLVLIGFVILLIISAPFYDE